MCQPEEDGGEAGRFWTKRAAAASRALGSREGARRRRAGRATARIQPPAGSAGAHMTRASGRSNQRRNERARKAWPRGARLPESRGPDQTDWCEPLRKAGGARASERTPHSRPVCHHRRRQWSRTAGIELVSARGMCVLVGWMPARAPCCVLRTRRRHGQAQRVAHGGRGRKGCGNSR